MNIMKLKELIIRWKIGRKVVEFVGQLVLDWLDGAFDGELW
jgi:hypothetical protein